MLHHIVNDEIKGLAHTKSVITLQTARHKSISQSNLNAGLQSERTMRPLFALNNIKIKKNYESQKLLGILF